MNTPSVDDLKTLTPSVGWPVTICVLFYGDHPDLAKRFFDNLFKHTPTGLFKLRIGLNEVCAETRRLAENHAKRIPGSIIHDSPDNLFKLPMMRKLFYEPPLESEWTIWFDDDSWVFRSDWLSSLALAIEAKPQVANFGKRFFVRPSSDTVELAKSSSWYKELPWDKLPDDGITPIFRFIAGGFWAIKTDVLQALDWPDRRIRHFIDDYILGEALHQNGYQIAQHYSGVAISDSIRRGPLDADCMN